MKKTLYRKPLFILFVLFFSLLSVSFIYDWTIKDHIKPERLQYDAKGNVVARAPFPPSLKYPLGTDRGGNNLALRMVEGAKYTIIFITIISLARMAISLVFSYLLIFPLKKVREWIQTLFVPFQYIPGFILVLLMSPNLMMLNDQIGYRQLVFFQFVLFVLIGIPVLSLLITSEANEILKNEYIEASYQMGAGNLLIFRKHIIPVLKDRLIVMFLQQITSILLLLIQLGVFQYFIGGQKPGAVSDDGAAQKKYLSQSGEWAGMIGQSKDEFLRAPWIFFGPFLIIVLIFVTLSILSGKIQRDSQ